VASLDIGREPKPLKQKRDLGGTNYEVPITIDDLKIKTTHFQFPISIFTSTAPDATAFPMMAVSNSIFKQ